MKAEIWDEEACDLGEGPIWHPTRAAWLWFDINGQRLIERRGEVRRTRDFDEPVTAAGWIDETSLLVAGASGLFRLDLDTWAQESVAPFEQGIVATRSNDGRADPWGGFWIGTMGLGKEPGAGAIYRYYKGELRVLHPGITIPNATCFAPDGGCAHWADTPRGQIMRQPLDEGTGWPLGEAEVFIDLRAEGLHPDGAVVDCEGNLWNAQWGAGRVACYDARGRFVEAIAVEASPHSTCPAFGGASRDEMIVTTAREGLDAEDLAREVNAGKTFICKPGVCGQEEHKVDLG